jgi:glycyl-tRNA synthetase beta subunit
MNPPKKEKIKDSKVKTTDLKSAVKPLLIEIGCEELPPEMQGHMEKESYSSITKILEENRLEFKDIKIFITPRRP